MLNRVNRRVNAINPAALLYGPLPVWAPVSYTHLTLPTILRV